MAVDVMELISLQRDWREDWPPTLTDAVEARTLECQRAMVSLCMKEIAASGLSPIAYFGKAYQNRQDGDFLAVVEGYLELDEQILAHLPQSHIQKLEAIIDVAERDIKALLSAEQCKAFADQGIRLLLFGIGGAGANHFFCELNELPGGESNEGDYREYFCPKPFEYAEIAQRGATFLCCPVMLPSTVGDASDGTFMDVWNSDKAQRIRASILDGSFSYCLERTCGVLQEKSLPKRKHITDPYHRNIIDNNLTELPKGPAEIVMNYDRSCNLACPTCRVDMVTISGEEKRAAARVQKWATADHLKDASRIHITGSGDALGSSLFHSFLREFDPESMPHLRISLGTNALLLTPRTWERICHEAIDIVVASCDAASPETYAVNRGADFDMLVENLRFIGSLRAAGKLKYFVMNYVVQKNNYNEMKDFVTLGQSVNADSVSFQQLTNWGPFGEAEFQRRAVHHPSHPEHAKFIRVLQDPIFRLPIVDMFNLVGIKDQAVKAMPQIGNTTSGQPAVPGSEDEKDAQSRLTNAVAVVQSYGKQLDLRNGSEGSEALDSRNLSHTKQVIKESLLLVLKSSADSTERKGLSAAFVLLAEFQDRSTTTERDKVDIERRSLIEELTQAGFGL